MLLFLHFSLAVLFSITQAQLKPRLPRQVVSAWYASWHADRGFPVSKVSWNKFTQMTYAFAETSPDVRRLDITNPEVLPEFVRQARRHGVLATVSVGGWTGSRFWSSAVATAKNRTLFVETVTDLATKYELDGLDFDWEYPGNQGLGCNTIVPEDTENFLAFVKELRAHPVGKRLLLSAATATVPFWGPDGVPLKDVSQFAKVLDYIAIMNYDLWGPWSPVVGPNAPLNDTCAPPAAQGSSAVSSTRRWVAAGIPRDQLVLGLAAYGHSFRVAKKDAFVSGSTTELALYAPFDSVNRPTGDSWDDPAGEVDPCGVVTTQGGVYNFWGIIEAGLLTEDGKPKKGVPYKFDTCSQTPYVYDEKNEVMISFDDPRSAFAKGKFIKDTGLRGFATWEAGGDAKDLLLDSVRQGAGYNGH